MHKNGFSCRKGFCQFLNIPIIYHYPKNQKKLCWTDANLIDGQTDKQTVGQTNNADFIEPSIWLGSNKQFGKIQEKIGKRKQNVIRYNKNSTTKLNKYKHSCSKRHFISINRQYQPQEMYFSNQRIDWLVPQWHFQFFEFLSMSLIVITLIMLVFYTYSTQFGGQEIKSHWNYCGVVRKV